MYAAPLDMEGVRLPKAMKVHNVEWIADGAARFIQNRAGGRPFCEPRGVATTQSPSCSCASVPRLCRVCIVAPHAHVHMMPKATHAPAR